MIYELWYSEIENSYSFIPKSGEYQNSIAQIKQFSPDVIKVWSYTAKSHFEAMQAYYNHLGFGQYTPEAGWEDIQYEE